MVSFTGQLHFCSIQRASRNRAHRGTNGSVWLHPSAAGAVCLLPPLPCYHCISQLVPSALKYSLRSCSEQYNKKSDLFSLDHKCKQYMMYDYLLPELHLIFILKTLPWFDLPCARGAVFNSSCPWQCPPCPGMGKDLALDHPWGLPGSQIRRGLNQSLHHPIMGSVKCCFSQSHPTTMGSLAFSQMGWRSVPHGFSIP